jgi:thiosulfate/3-mercaptopyruvate sulfurtransferase
VSLLRQIIAAAKFKGLNMLYTGYDFQRGWLAGAGWVAQKQAEWINALPAPFKHGGMAPVAASALEVFAHSVLPRGKPAFGLKEVYMLSKKFPTDTDLEPGTKIFEFEPIDKLPASYKLSGIVNKAFMEKNLTRLQIFDTRTKEEYDGKIPRMTNPEQGTLCGRLPGAFLWDWRSFYDSEGSVVDRVLFTKRLQSFPFMPERTTVLYDYNGARSCLPALMLKEVGYQDVHTYQGSWFEWRRSSLPKQAVSIFGSENKTTSAPRVGGIDRKKP